MESKDNSKPAEEQPINISQRHELDLFISLYAKTQNFVSVIRGSEYDKGVCRIRRYACKHQGHNSAKNKTNIAENQ
ncbi:28059_t:CDS:2 [Dentiscutata erythropus]|uniref:28059_t:CDS:1 n=1 Tax=Dentiscutata erythropus TaxID=1348616 RepID=A0A9N9PD45_9GLOM|nr:28059_t:CDS:2 [Dentiscutata erythropus]